MPKTREQTEITHSNRYTYADGRTEEKTWQRYKHSLRSIEGNLVANRDSSQNWIGTSMTMTPDLKVSPAVPTQLHWAIEGNETFFFPNGISLSCPGKVQVGKKIAIAVNWLVNSTYMQQITIEYDELGAFSSLIFEEFRLSDDSEQNYD